MRARWLWEDLNDVVSKGYYPRYTAFVTERTTGSYDALLRLRTRNNQDVVAPRTFASREAAKLWCEHEVVLIERSARDPLLNASRRLAGLPVRALWSPKS